MSGPHRQKNIPATRETIPFFVSQLVPTRMTEGVCGRARARRQQPLRGARLPLSARLWTSPTNWCGLNHRHRQARPGCAPQRARWWAAAVPLGSAGEVCQRVRALGPARETAAVESQSPSRFNFTDQQQSDHTNHNTCDDTMNPYRTPVPPE